MSTTIYLSIRSHREEYKRSNKHYHMLAAAFKEDGTFLDARAFKNVADYQDFIHEIVLVHRPSVIRGSNDVVTSLAVQAHRVRFEGVRPVPFADEYLGYLQDAIELTLFPDKKKWIDSFPAIVRTATRVYELAASRE